MANAVYCDVCGELTDEENAWPCGVCHKEHVCSSCGGHDDGEHSGITGWYCDDGCYSNRPRKHGKGKNNHR